LKGSIGTCKGKELREQPVINKKKRGSFEEGGGKGASPEETAGGSHAGEGASDVIRSRNDTLGPDK